MTISKILPVWMGCCLILSLCPSAGEKVADQQLASLVKPIQWENFDGTLKPNETRELCGRILLRSAKFNAEWFLKKKNSIQIEPSQKGLRHEEGIIRPATSASLGLATILKTGLFDEKATNVSRKELMQRLIHMIRSVASRHTINGGIWGHNWQSSLWSAQLGRAAWMIWDELDGETRTMLGRIIESEADRYLPENYAIEYWNGKGGDTKAEEHSWESMILQQAVIMMPKHERVRRWKEACSQLMISAHSRRSDMSRTNLTLDGKTPQAWLKGFNIMEDGLLKNHDIVHNDYMVSMAHLQMQGFLAFSLAGTPVPETTDFNFAVIYKALVTREFRSPPFRAPGGTMYIPGKPENYTSRH